MVILERPVNECYSCEGNEISFSKCLRRGNQHWTFRVGCRSHEQVVREITTDNGGITMDTTNDQELLSTDQSSESDTTSPWVITGVLAVVLQATIIGWIVSCICLSKKQR